MLEIRTADVFGGKNSREKKGVFSGKAAIFSVIFSIIVQYKE